MSILSWHPVSLVDVIRLSLCWRMLTAAACRRSQSSNKTCPGDQFISPFYRPPHLLHCNTSRVFSSSHPDPAVSRASTTVNVSAPCGSAPLCVRSHTCLSGGKTIGIGGRAQYCPSKYRRIVPPPSEGRLSCFCAFRSDFDPSNLHLQIRTCVQAGAGQSVVGSAARHWRFF